MRYLKDATGVYNLDAVTALTASKDGHAVLHMASGGAHVTETAFDTVAETLTAPEVAPVASAPAAQ